MHNDFPIWIVPVGAVMVFLAILANAGGGTAGLQRWADENELELVSVERRRWDKGPFLFRTGKNGKVYYITARNSAGQHRSGFARVKPPFGLLFSDPVKIAWDDADWR